MSLKPGDKLIFSDRFSYIPSPFKYGDIVTVRELAVGRLGIFTIALIEDTSPPDDEGRTNLWVGEWFDLYITVRNTQLKSGGNI